MEKIGVEAVVEGLSSFLGDMKKVDDSIAGVVPSSSLLGKALGGLGDVVQWLTGSVLNVLEYTLGNLLSSAIQFVITQISDLISSVIEAGNEFQTLEIRLTNFNKNALMSRATEEYIDVSKEAVAMTKEQLTWLQKLAVATPYDATDIANTYTLARSYSFVDEEARGLTKTIVDFASGMGLGSVEIKRIITNFGQMVQQGKVTQREMNDLARGAFVPVNDVLQRMQENVGKTGEEFTKFRNSGEGVNAFMTAFTQIVEERFAGATEAMASTWKGATDNVKDFFQSVLGLQVIKPILDTLGKNVSSFLTAFTEGDRWDAITTAASRIGESLSGIVSDLLGLGGGADSMADGLVSAFENVASWLETNRASIVQWVQDSVSWVKGKLIPAIQGISDWIQNSVVPAFMRISDWYNTHKDGIYTFFVTLSDIIKTVFSNLTGEMPSGDFLGAILQGITNFMAYVIANKEQIAEWVTNLIKVYAVLTIIGTILGIVGKAIVAVASFLLSFFLAAQPVFAILSSIYTVFNWISALLLTTVSTAFLVVMAIIANVILIFKALQVSIYAIQGAIPILVNIFKTWFNQLVGNVRQTASDIVTAFKNKDWLGIGKAIIDGIVRGISIHAINLWNIVVSLANNALAAVKKAFGISSPSAEFFDVGSQLMKGLSNGISQNSDLVKQAMTSLAETTLSAGVEMKNTMTSQMAPSSVSNVSNTNNYNLSIQTSAKTEPIMQDFQMMQSLSG